jgi:NAD(P)H-flavin reductase
MTTTEAVREARTDPMLPRLYRVARRQRELRDTFTLDLTCTDDGAALAYQPGQFNMLYVFGVGEIPISISGDSAEPGKLVHTTRAVGMVSNALCNLKVGDMVGVRGPYGSAWPLELAEGHDVVVAAGGIGLAPLRPTLYAILRRRERFGRVILLYGARTPHDLLYRRELEQWRRRAELDLLITVDAADAAWQGAVGVVTQLIPHASFDAQRAIALTCGPEIMMRFTALALEKRGVAADRLFVSMERNMKCAVGFCGHCQYSGTFVCKDGPVFPYSRVRALLTHREI